MAYNSQLTPGGVSLRVRIRSCTLFCHAFSDLAIRSSILRGVPGLRIEGDVEDVLSAEGIRLYLTKVRIRKRATAVLRMRKWTRSKRIEGSMLTVDDVGDARQ